MKNSILKALNKLTGGKGDKKSLSDFPSKEVAMGQKVEMEHTSDPKLADEITADHLTENPHYYSKLKESGLADELEKGVKTFHGTVQNFDKFKLPKKSGPVLNYGTGIYSATSPEEAAEYAEPQPHYRDADAAAFSEMRSNKKIKAHLDSQAKKYGLKGSDDYKHKNYDKYRNEFEKPYVHNHISEKLKYTPHVKRLDVDIKNAFDPHNLDHAKKIAALAGHAKSFDGMEDLANDKDNPTNFWDMLTDGETLGWNERTRDSDFWRNFKRKHPNSRYDLINSLIQQAGFDGIHDKKQGHVVAFKPKQVKQIPFGKTESLAKAPVEYTPDPQDTHKKIPALNDSYPIINKVNLPNGLIYQQHTKNDYRGPVHVHHLYHPDEKNPVAEVITRPDPDNEMNHQVSYSQVSPEHKGKGLGKQAYLAALVHGKGVGRLVSDNEVSQNAHKLWGHFKNVKGLGGKIGKYVRKDAYGQLPESNISDKAYYDQHQVFIKQKSALDHNAMFPPIEGSGQEKLAASEPLEKDQPTLKFPKVKDVPSRTDVEMYSIPEGRTKSANRKKEIAARAGTNRARLGYEEMSGKKLPQASYDKDVANKKKLISEIANSRDKKGVSAGVVSTPGMGGKSFKGRSIGYYSETNPRYVQQHEAAHLTLQHIADKHGENARRKVVDHLLAHFHPDDVNAMARKLGGGSYSQSNHLSEEVLNFLHDLPHKDEKIKAHYAAHGVDENRVKTGWKRASQYAREKITPEWLADEGSDVNSIIEQSKSLRPTDLTLRNPGKLAASEGLSKSLNRKTGVSGVSENIGLDRLKQIKQDNYVGAGGKDYSPDELHQRMFEIQDKQAAKQKLFPEQESEKTHGSFEEMAPPPMKGFKKSSSEIGYRSPYRSSYLRSQDVKQQQKNTEVRKKRDVIGSLNEVRKPKASARNELKKAIDPRDFKKIQTSHQKGFSTVVDSASHVKDHPAHEDFVDHVVNNPHVYKNKSGKEQGIATKTIHHLDGFEDEDGDFVRKVSPTTFMVKPYHGHLESATKSYVKHPIKGWATLATKDLLHAAGMGHMTEDVQAHVHNGVPVTVHRFSKDHEPAFIHKGDALHPRDVAKVAIMDFLTGNNDRHAGNIMVSANKNEEGYHNPLLIDHERNFNYHRSIENKFAPASNGPGKDSPYHTFKHSYGLRAVGHEHEGHPIMEQMDDVHRWWNEAAPQVHAAFQKNIKHIKDPHIRTHIENNFNARMNYLEDNLLNGNYYDMFKGVKKGPWSNETHPAMGGVNIIPFRKPRST